MNDSSSYAKLRKLYFLPSYPVSLSAAKTKTSHPDFLTGVPAPIIGYFFVKNSLWSVVQVSPSFPTKVPPRILIHLFIIYHSALADPGEGPGGAGPLLIFRPNWGPKNIFLETAPLLFLRVWMTADAITPPPPPPPPNIFSLFQVLDPALFCSVVSGHLLKRNHSNHSVFANGR